MNNNINYLKKIERKQKRCQHIVEKEVGILPCFSSTKNIVICNAGLTSGLTEENIINAFSSFGPIEKILLLPKKSCSFVCYKEKCSAESAYNAINGKLNLGQYNKPLYLLYTDIVPNNLKTQTTFPPGLFLFPDYISDEEENLLLSCIEWNNIDTSSLKHRRVKHYGYEFRYDINNVDKNSPLTNGIPSQCRSILDRFYKTNKYEHFEIDQLTINEYKPGQGIPPHIDTHSAFEDPILSLSLGASVKMEFKHNDGRHISVLLPRKSLLVMSGEARYAWSHGITPRKFDIVPTNDGLTVCERGLRTSFTFRKVRRGECSCKYTDNCDSYASRNAVIENNLAEELEAKHVYAIYEEIASHFSDTRHKPWPNVLEFINSFAFGSILIDVGCGNGKYLGHNKTIFEVGCDRSFNLSDICRVKGSEIFNCNCLYIPIRDNVADGVISIAVIHHLANPERRLQAIREVMRILRTGGRALIYVWAKDQEKFNKSSYLKQDRKNRRSNTPPEITNEPAVNISENVSLPVHVNRTQFQSQDVLVPWKLKQKQDLHVENNNTNLFLRYYHVFEEGELDALCNSIKNTRILKSYYDQGNWCVVIEKVSCM